MVRWVWTWTTVCSPAWHWTPSTVCPVAALSRGASFGPFGTGTVSGPGFPGGGRIHDERATSPDADAHPSRPRLSGALFGGALLILRPALGLRLALTGH